MCLGNSKMITPITCDADLEKDENNAECKTTIYKAAIYM